MTTQEYIELTEKWSQCDRSLEKLYAEEYVYAEALKYVVYTDPSKNPYPQKLKNVRKEISLLKREMEKLETKMKKLQISARL